MLTIKKQITDNGRKGLLLVASLILSFSSLKAQDQTLEEKILEKDAMFWKAYNSCDIPTMNKFFADDIEFYHDKGGIELGSKNLIEGLKKGLCQTGKNHLRREAIAKSIAVFPLMNNNQVYGAIISGEHLFYIQEEDSEQLDGQARFNNLWLLKDGEWKMYRVLSYDHRAPEYKSTKQEVSLNKEALEQLAGNYVMSSNDVISVKAFEDSLKLEAMGKVYIIYPESNNQFFSKERDLTFFFTVEAPRKLQIFEGDSKVAEATYSE
ncbi:MAG: nuclear transport factor 2 family protein [Christiangramia sp.]